MALFDLRELGIVPNDLREEITFKVPTHLKCFEGHFPGNPILPAYLMIDISLSLGVSLKLLPSQIKEVSTGKFLAAIKPGDELKIIVEKEASSVNFIWQQKQNSEWKKASQICIEV